MRRVAESLEMLRADLTNAYGWCDLAWSAERGECRVRSVVPSLASRVARSFPGTVIDRVPEGERATLRTPVVQLRRECGPLRTLATELFRGDGEVRILDRRGECFLVRGTDGSIGWCEGLAGSGSARMPRVHDWRGAVRCFSGVPYRLGGATMDGIDCSALAQRLYRDLLRVSLPRHSTRQMGFVPAAARPRSGDLVFIRAARGAAWHVGVFIGGDVLHASSSRGRVVAESWNEFTASAAEIRVRGIR